jgi:hypothetical protein
VRSPRFVVIALARPRAGSPRDQPILLSRRFADQRCEATSPLLTSAPARRRSREDGSAVLRPREQRGYRSRFEFATFLRGLAAPSARIRWCHYPRRSWQARTFPSRSIATLYLEAGEANYFIASVLERRRTIHHRWKPPSGIAP